jgi:hypothetical protein
MVDVLGVGERTACMNNLENPDPDRVPVRDVVKIKGDERREWRRKNAHEMAWTRSQSRLRRY